MHLVMDTGIPRPTSNIRMKESASWLPSTANKARSVDSAIDTSPSIVRKHVARKARAGVSKR